ncbi:hypothetical protein ANN_27207 [Periplaneta americana]|uniref:EHMT1/2 cysteine-rich region domain-containing protein n=1 Tax=Periplaneta americana TaxID=6978 RepID=A0ABQ8RXJ7_PERAM|nr:hypothetical protein ANN_27207 [Periplaneta americana]
MAGRDHRANHTIPPFWLVDRSPLQKNVDVRPAVGWSALALNELLRHGFFYGATHPHPYHRQLHIAEPKSAVVQETLKTTTNSVETGRLSKAGTAAFCCCQMKSQLFVSSRGQNGTAGELYCQAMDTLDDRLVGCCNAVTAQDTRLSRPSRRVPYLILCDVHMQRLLRHNCCPGCGIFCTQMLNGVLWSRSISKQMKKRILQTIVESILTYGAEGWALVERQKCKIQATEMEGIRRAARVSRLERNEDVRKMMEMEESDERRKMAKDYSGMVTTGKEEACETKKNMESWCHANGEGPTHAGGELAGSRRMAEGNSG